MNDSTKGIVFSEINNLINNLTIEEQAIALRHAVSAMFATGDVLSQMIKEDPDAYEQVVIFIAGTFYNALEPLIPKMKETELKGMATSLENAHNILMDHRDECCKCDKH